MEPMTIQQFAEKYRLKVTRDSCGDAIVQGRLYKDANISEYDEGLCMCWLTKESHAKKFNSTKRACLSAGMTIVQEGDDEAIFLFDGANNRQAKLAISSIRAKVKKVLSPEALAKLLNVGFKAQKTTQIARCGV
jgi:hypothetical protein